MGQILSSPITTKHSTEGKDNRLSFGASEMQGWRISMEDAHTHILSYKDTGASFFAVYDGHGGSNVAKYAAEKLFGNVLESEDFKKGKIKEALVKGFFQIDSDLLGGKPFKKLSRIQRIVQHLIGRPCYVVVDSGYMNEPSGCTAIVALLTKENVLYVSNAGDSRAIICTNGVAIALSNDHKPTNPMETERINKAGGHVEFGRVNGNLALSRAFGDFGFKQNKDLPPEKQAVTADPDVTIHRITPRDDFMVLACDGIWDCMTNQQVASFIRKQVAQSIPLKEICERIMDYCLADKTNTAGIGCDNMTIEIVAFLNGQSEEAWYEKIKTALGSINESDISVDVSSYNGVADGTYKSTEVAEEPEEPDKKKHRANHIKNDGPVSMELQKQQQQEEEEALLDNDTLIKEEQVEK